MPLAAFIAFAVLIATLIVAVYVALVLWEQRDDARGQLDYYREDARGTFARAEAYRREVERLRRRTHQIQAAESARAGRAERLAHKLERQVDGLRVALTLASAGRRAEAGLWRGYAEALERRLAEIRGMMEAPLPVDYDGGAAGCEPCPTTTTTPTNGQTTARTTPAGGSASGGAVAAPPRPVRRRSGPPGGPAPAPPPGLPPTGPASTHLWRPGTG